ncbi:class E sortase [Phytoactinopolyspora mesophila]|uniref:Class E sortase n=1 Tax=Phytoactinopolyspora mesophila TaxID=2650750 RepID=A0A7K3MCD0_9ACTN|nr:class E sortase [Phytoactinopolyspora mesophila]NDL60687.1 class E sortase [Phytoactinopolyspora mesophila]
MERETEPKRRGARRAAPRRGPVGMVVGFFGELLMTAGVVVLLFVVYVLWGTGLQTAAAQNDLRGELSFDVDSSETDGEALAPDDIDIGEAYGVIRIPRFGEDWEWVMVQGVEDEDLKNGPGHYPNSANPGELGNFAVAAHRSGHGEPFAKFPELHVGDIIEVVMADGTYVYEIDDAPNGDPDGNKIEIQDTWVVDPVPGEPRSTEPTERRITLTTCWPRFGSSHRMFATGVLISEEAR